MTGTADVGPFIVLCDLGGGMTGDTKFLVILVLVIAELCDAKPKGKSGCEKKNSITVCPARPKTREEACSSENEVMIVVSPLLDEETSKRLEIVWYVEAVHDGDIIKLYKKPNFQTAKPVFAVQPKSEYGYSETHIYESFLDIELKFKPVCMGYWVAYWRAGQVLYSSCLQTNPTWMKDYSYFFSSLRLFDMFIPGTHDSSAYHMVYNPEVTKENRLEKYVYTQEEPILDQLLHGARSLDLRVGHDKGVYYAHHYVARLYKFEEVVDNVLKFMNSTEEILILDFHEFSVGFPTEKEHTDFINYLHAKFGEHAAPPQLGWTATLQQFWNAGKRLILAYNEPKMVAKNPDFLWPPVTQMWGNKQKVEDLYEYLSGVFKSPPEGMWSAQAELTAKTGNILWNSLGGLRKMASQTNTQVTKWFRGKWGELSHVVAMDFIRASAIVDVAIELNLRRSFDEEHSCEEVAKPQHRGPTSDEDVVSDQDDPAETYFGKQSEFINWNAVMEDQLKGEENSAPTEERHGLTDDHHGLTDDHHGLTDDHHGLTDDHHGLTDDHHGLYGLGQQAESQNPAQTFVAGNQALSATDGRQENKKLGESVVADEYNKHDTSEVDRVGRKHDLFVDHSEEESNAGRTHDPFRDDADDSPETFHRLGGQSQFETSDLMNLTPEEIVKRFFDGDEDNSQFVPEHDIPISEEPFHSPESDSYTFPHEHGGPPRDPRDGWPQSRLIPIE